MWITRLFAAAVVAAVLVVADGVAAPAGSGSRQAVPAAAATTRLSIGGDVARPLDWRPEELKAMPRTTVTVQENAQPVVYAGVLVSELLGRAGATLGRDLTGPALATYVRAIGADGYEVVFSLAELDPAMTSNEIIVADSVDAKLLLDFQGPLRIVAPHDKRGARYVRQLVRLEVVRLRKSVEDR